MSATKFCTVCRNELSEGAAFCTRCGKRAERAKNQGLPKWIVGILILLGLLIMVALGSLPSGPDQRAGVAAMAKLSPAEMRQARIDFAKQFDGLMLDAGIESTTTVSKQDDTVLEIKDVLAGRVRARQLGSVLPFKKLKSLGFKYVVYTNGVTDIDDPELAFWTGWEVR